MLEIGFSNRGALRRVRPATVQNLREDLRNLALQMGDMSGPEGLTRKLSLHLGTHSWRISAVSVGAAYIQLLAIAEARAMNTDTPESVLAIRDELVQVYEAGGEEVRDSRDKLLQAETVLWDRQLEQVALNGCDIWLGRPLILPPATIPNQIWFYPGFIRSTPRGVGLGVMVVLEGGYLSSSEVGIYPDVETGGLQFSSPWAVGRIGDPIAEPLHSVVASLHFLALPWVNPEAHRWERRLRRGAELGRRRALPTLTVVKLRRESLRPDRRQNDQEPIEWGSCWLRRPHWRAQRCKNENGQWTTKPVMVVEQKLRGDPTKPLRMREGLVYHVTR